MLDWHTCQICYRLEIKLLLLLLLLLIAVGPIITLLIQMRNAVYLCFNLNLYFRIYLFDTHMFKNVTIRSFKSVITLSHVFQ